MRTHRLDPRLRPWLSCLFAFSLAFSLTGCGGSEEGDRRPLVGHWDGGPPKIKRFEGEEVYTRGEWVKDGATRFYDQEGRLTHVGEYRLGLESGIWTETDAEGRKTSEGRFVDGRRDGEWVYYYASGNVQEQGKYAAGQRVGLWTQWYANGAKLSEKPYVDGALEGQVRVWLPDGTLDPDSSGRFVKGERVGPL